MVEHRFYCGTDPPVKIPKNGRALQAHGPDRNIELDPLRVSKWLATTIPPRLRDLIDIAAYVFAADRITRRGGPAGKDMGKDWRRNLYFSVAVRDPDHWSKPELVTTLCEMLGFMSEDDYTFEFTRLNIEPPLQDYLSLHEDTIASGDCAPVILFSGGLDSLAGALEELAGERRRFILVTHHSSDFMAGHQNELANALRGKYGDRIIYLPVRNNLTNGLQPNEGSQRTRTFFFSAIAATVAVILGAPGIRFYENGIMSLNLPISAQVVGTSATRSTHPRLLAEMALFLEGVIEKSVAVDNPFIFKTKAEVLNVIEHRGHLDLIEKSISCTEVRKRVKDCTHCGACVQCLHRRAGVLAAGLGSHDNSRQYARDLFKDARDGKDRTMLVDLVRSARHYSKMSVAGFMQAYPLELARLNGVPGHGQTEMLVQGMYELHRRHGEQFEKVLEHGIEQHKEALAKGLMAPGSLLTFVVGEQFAKSRQTSPHAPAAQSSGSKISLMIDSARNIFRVNNSKEIRGKKSVALLILLAEQHRKDRNADRNPAEFEYLSSRFLTTTLDVDVDALRRRIERLRDRIAAGLTAAGIESVDQDVVIQSKSWNGYRLNPGIRLIAPK